MLPVITGTRYRASLLFFPLYIPTLLWHSSAYLLQYATVVVLLLLLYYYRTHIVGSWGVGGSFFPPVCCCAVLLLYQVLRTAVVHTTYQVLLYVVHGGWVDRFKGVSTRSWVTLNKIQ